MRRRLLPEAAYDFFARDSYDNERGPIRDTLAEAQDDVRMMRSRIDSWNRSRIQCVSRLNERKIAKLLKGKR